MINEETIVQTLRREANRAILRDDLLDRILSRAADDEYTIHPRRNPRYFSWRLSLQAKVALIMIAAFSVLWIQGVSKQSQVTDSGLTYPLVLDGSTNGYLDPTINACRVLLDGPYVSLEAPTEPQSVGQYVTLTLSASETLQFGPTPPRLHFEGLADGTYRKSFSWETTLPYLSNQVVEGGVFAYPRVKLPLVSGWISVLLEHEVKIKGEFHTVFASATLFIRYPEGSTLEGVRPLNQQLDIGQTSVVLRDLVFTESETVLRYTVPLVTTQVEQLLPSSSTSSVLTDDGLNQIKGIAVIIEPIRITLVSDAGVEVPWVPRLLTFEPSYINADGVSNQAIVGMATPSTCKRILVKVEDIREPARKPFIIEVSLTDELVPLR